MIEMPNQVSVGEEVVLPTGGGIQDPGDPGVRRAKPGQITDSTLAHERCPFPLAATFLR
ncbi:MULTISPECIES: hypothetical protein [unclassified Nonomuraea]|uniref:hypothetical protein n=1 Tax=unclassified Nonomuraea TaxID=2593643 RepID=UPI00340F35EE